MTEKKKKKLMLLINLKDLYGSDNVEDYRYMGGAEYFTKYNMSEYKYNVHYKYLLKLIDENDELKDSINMCDILKEHDNSHETNPYYCVCNHKIRQRCFIIKKDKNMIYKNFITIGNCCIKLFYKDKFKKLCKCGKSHRNNKDNLCNECRTIEENKNKRKCLDCGIIIRKNSPSKICKNCKSLFNKYISYKNIFNSLFTKKIEYGKYKNDLVINLLKDTKYFNYIKEAHPITENTYLIKISNTSKLMDFLKKMETVLLFLNNYNNKKYPSIDYMDYIN